MSPAGGPVFISYRRQVGAELAHLVDSELRARGVPTFIDVARPEAGQFWKQIQAAIGACRAFVLICTSDTFQAVAEGQDWMLREINEAVAQNRRIVPVFSSSFKRPPSVSEAVAQALECSGVTMDTQFPDAVFDRLRDLVGGARRWTGRRTALAAAGLALVVGLVATVAARSGGGGGNANANANGGGATPGPQPSGVSLERVVRHEVIGMQREYFESFAGPAIRVVDGRRSYHIDGCDIETTLDGNAAVKSIRLTLSQRCTFNPKEFFWNYTLPPPGQLTFGQFATAFDDARFVASCITNCGNAMAPEFFFLHTGSHADDFLDALAGGTVDDDDNAAPFVRLGQEMARNEGNAYVDDARFNCDNKYHARARALLGQQRVRFIEIGRELAPPELANCK